MTTLYMAIVGEDSNIYVASSNNGKDWSAPGRVFPNTTFQTLLPVALASVNQRFYMAIVGEDTNIYLTASLDGISWSSPERVFPDITFQALTAVALSAFGNELCLVIRGEDLNIYSSVSSQGVWSNPELVFSNFQTQQTPVGLAQRS